MIKYILRRILYLIPILFGVTFLVFTIISFTPGDPAMIILGEQAPPEALAQLREEMGLNRPFVVQYGMYILSVLQGDFGISYKTKLPVADEIAARLPATFILTVVSVLVAILIALPVGIISATRQYSAVDSVSMLFALLGVATPNFWLGLMLIILFSLHLRLLPTGGWGGPETLIMPAITLGTGAAAIITRMTRSSMLEVIRQDYIRTARAKGVAEKIVVRKHALLNALIPVVTVVGLQFGSLLGGAVLTETVFSWPGIGRLMVEAIRQKNTPMVLGCVIVFASLFTLVNLLIDILYAFLDPRIKARYK